MLAAGHLFLVGLLLAHPVSCIEPTRRSKLGAQSSQMPGKNSSSVGLALLASGDGDPEGNDGGPEGNDGGYEGKAADVPSVSEAVGGHLN